LTLPGRTSPDLARAVKALHLSSDIRHEKMLAPMATEPMI
jgi:hypothetical protein